MVLPASMKIKVNQGYDELIHISDLTPNPTNNVMYGDITKDERIEYIQKLAFHKKINSFSSYIK